MINELDATEPVVTLIQYKEETAGAYMNNDILYVQATDDVKDVTKVLIKSAADLKPKQYLRMKHFFRTNNP